MDLGIEGRVALVLGASRGIGRAVATELVAEGARVAIASRSREALDELATQIGATVFEHDNAALDTVPSLVEAVTRALGPIEILVTNTGGPPASPDPLAQSTEDWEAAYRTLVLAPLALIRAVLPGMRERGFGRIVNIGSINGQGGQYGQVNYAAAKSGIHGFTKALAQEGASKGITVNAIAPGYTDTDMVSAVPANVLEKIVAKIPVGRLGKADEIARGVLFLIADDAGFITGSTLSINGGQHMY